MYYLISTIKSRITSYNVCYTKLLRHIFANTRIDADVQRREVIPRLHAVHIGQRDGALGLVEHAALGVALEQLADLALAGGHHHEIGFGGKARITSYNVCYTKLLRWAHPPS